MLAVLAAPTQVKLPQMVLIRSFPVLPQQGAVKVRPDLQPLVMVEVVAVEAVLTTPAQGLGFLDKDILAVLGLVMV